MKTASQDIMIEASRNRPPSAVKLQLCKLMWALSGLGLAVAPAAAGCVQTRMDAKVSVSDKGTIQSIAYSGTAASGNACGKILILPSFAKNATSKIIEQPTHGRATIKLNGENWWFYESVLGYRGADQFVIVTQDQRQTLRQIFVFDVIPR